MYENELVGVTPYHTKGLARSLALIQRQTATRNGLLACEDQEDFGCLMEDLQLTAIARTSNQNPGELNIRTTFSNQAETFSC